jgi:exodeoxyribonuclease VII small subunit
MPRQGYKAMMEELQMLLADMQTEDIDVDAAIVKYERGQELIAQLEKYLETAENKIMIHKVNEDSKAD